MSTPYNQRIYGELVRPIVDGDMDDFAYVCNQMAKLYKQIDDPCTDNFRACKVVDGCVTGDYADAIDNGCCGSVDETVTNPKTGNSFSIGFNFGH